MGVKIRLASELDPRGFDAAERRLAGVKDKALAHSQSIAGSFMRTGGAVVGFGDKVQNVGGAVSGAGDSMTRNISLPLVAIGALAFKTAGDFEQSMNLVQAATDAPAGEMAKLQALAKQMGADTVFSANEAAGAMLELAKSGMTPAQIQAGALDSALQLAAAGQIGLESAATVTANALNMFGLKAGDAGAVADALAGGANASSASVDSLQQALSQVGPGARNAGLSLQDTVGVLAAFADRGIQGSDAGTSLKTMLARLVPSTDAAAKAMDRYGLSFVDSKGNIDDITVVAEKLQNKLGGLTQEQRNAALAQIFGSDATRAATVLMQQGSEGTEKYIKATKDREAAERMADAAMKGSKGSIEEMKGSVETAGLAIGQGLAPTIITLAGEVKGLADSFSNLSPQQQQSIVKFGLIAVAAGPVLSIVGRLTSTVGLLTKGLGYSITGVGRFIGGLRGAEGAASTFAGKLGLGISKLGQWAAAAAVNAANAARTLATSIAQGVVHMVRQASYTAMGIGLWVKETAVKVANTAATVAHSVATTAVNVATKAWAAGQWLLNAALTANPIGLVVAAIALLIGGIVLAWKNSETFRNVVTAAWNGIKAAASAVFGWLGTWIPKIFDSVKAKTSAVWNGIKAFMGNVWTGIVAVFKITPLGFIITNFSKIVEFFRGVPGRIKTALGNVGNLLKDAGGAIVQGLWDGMLSLWNRVKGWVSGIADWIKQNKGPIDKDYQLLQPAGLAIMGGFGDALDTGFAAVRSKVQGYTLALGQTSFGGGGFSPAFAAGSGSRSVSIDLTIHAPGATPETVSTLRDAGDNIVNALALELMRG